MEVEIIREEPKLPPVSQIVLYLDPDEASLLKVMMGSISRTNIRQIWNERIEDDVVDEVFRFVSLVYNTISEGIRGEKK